MTTTTLNAEIPREHRAAPQSLRLVRAELLKVRKRRGLVAATLALTIAPMIVAYAILVIVHAADPAKHGPAGGEYQSGAAGEHVHMDAIEFCRVLAERAHGTGVLAHSLPL